MVQNTQNYLNGLINKPKIAYLDLSSPCSVSTCEKCNKKTYSENSPNLTGEIEDLKEFQNLKVLNASNSKLTKLEGLFTLPNKGKLEKINLFGNRIKEVDFARLFSEFPNLKLLNLDYNPLSAKNLTNLTDKQLEKLVEGMKSGKIRFRTSQGTIQSDLWEYVRELVSKGRSSQANKLEAVIQQSSVVKPSKKTDKFPVVPLIIGIVLLVSLVLAIGYWVGKKK
ncbi:MAG: hypothetical protein I3273_01600 [Candidatus Moeniiplasma glomeromycotorum]|nr:hypothetical protein [Candidatus Moeniiplasma glomeromycotorum]MCE8167183.1 hypothetical protein [Candidatus Moeniiplasma glomeromycotorum]MCE8168805.1 hypothetical protein [Candidatus Moeniiplasma glomeromycotorum]